MDAIASIRAVQRSGEFLRWKDVNESAYLTSAFAMYSEGQKKRWLISYYSTKTGKLTTFSLNSQKGQEDAFRKETDIPKLRLSEVKVNDEAAEETANRLLQDNYAGEKVQRTILVLQKLETEPLWNITFITTTLKVVNIKLSAVSGKEIFHSMSNISDFMQK